MDGVSKSNKSKISADIIYDGVVFIYILAIFVLENAKYSQVFSIIQIAFFGYSILMLGRYLKASFCLKWCIVVFLFAGILAILNYCSETMTTLVIVIKNLLKVFFFYSYMREERRIEKLIKYVGIAGVICGINILLEFLGSGMSYSNLKYATINRIGAEIAGGNVNIVGMDMCIAFASWLYMVGRIEKKPMKVTAFCIMAFILATSLLTGSRKILIFYVVTFVIANLQSSKRNLILVIGGMIALYVALMEIEPLYFLIGHKLDFFGGNTAYTMYRDSDVNRLVLAERGLRTFIDRPWGIGFGNSRNYIGSYAHTNYVEVLASLGLIGFPIFYSSYFHSLYVCSKNRSQPLCRYTIYTVIGILLLELGQVTYLYSVPMAFLAIIMAIAATIYNNTSESISE